nr:MBOAT family O-acyltransferase [Vibrio nigripulchritudo]
MYYIGEKDSTSILSTSIFFPHVLAGPILHKPLTLESNKNQDLLYRNLFIGIAMFSLGTILLECSTVIYERFEYINSLNYFNSYISATIFYLYLFSNFFGYSMIASGYAKFFGIEIPINFMAPGLSRNPSEFWLRWHRSLSLFFRNYVFKSLIKRNINILVATFLVMVLSGIWHGWGWNYIIWGGVHGTLLILYKLFSNSRYERIKFLAFFVLIPVTWIPFYSNSYHELTSNLLLLTAQNIPALNDIGIKASLCILISTALILTPYNRVMKFLNIEVAMSIKEPYGRHSTKIKGGKTLYFVILMALVVLGILFSYGVGTNSTFEYQRF